MVKGATEILVLVPLTALSCTLVYMASKMSSVHNWKVLTSRAASDSKLNKWEGSLIVTVVGLLTHSPNLPQKTPRRKKGDEEGGNDNTKKEHRTGTC